MWGMSTLWKDTGPLCLAKTRDKESKGALRVNHLRLVLDLGWLNITNWLALHMIGF